MRRFLLVFGFSLLFFSKFISSVFSTSLLQKRDPYHSKSTLNLCLRLEPSTLDPRKNSDGVTAQFLSLLYEGLIEIGSNKEVKYGIASSLQASHDGKMYTITLKNALWSNGDKITSSDFKRSWLEVLSPSFGAYNPDYFFNIANAQAIYQKKMDQEAFGVEIVDEKTFKVFLERPDPYFPELLSNKLFFPVHPSVNSKAFEKNRIVFPGSFCINNWRRQDKIELKPNIFHRNYERSRLEAIELYILEEEYLQLDMFEKGKLDWIGAPFSTFSLDAMECIRLNPCFRVYKTPSLYHFTINVSSFPLNHPKIRKALAISLDRKSLIHDVLGGEEEPAFSLLPQQLHGIHQTYFTDGDVLKAKELFEQGLQDLSLSYETFPKITLKYPSLQLSHIVAQAVQQQWFKILGINISIQSAEWKGFLSDLNRKNYQIAAVGKGTHLLDPYFFLLHYKNKAQLTNRCGFEHPHYIELLDQAQEEVCQKKRAELLHKAEALLMHEMPIIPLFFQNNYCLINRKLKNIQISPLGEVKLTESFFE